MIKRIEIHGERVKLYSFDNGRTWSSNPQGIVAYGQRKQILRGDLQKAFERLNDVQDPEANTVVPLGTRLNRKEN
jgi:hypothetical protein